jgi:hypothetical protein
MTRKMTTKAELEEELAALQAHVASLKSRNEQLQSDLTAAKRAQTGINRVKQQERTYQDESAAKGTRRPPAHWSTYLNEVDGFGPPLQVLDVTLTGGDVLWLSISAYAEDHESKATTKLNEIAVDADALYELIQFMIKDYYRTDTRKWGGEP